MRRGVASTGRGVALVAVLLAMLMLGTVVAVLGAAVMSETAMALDQARGQQALAVAEAGAVRVLAELRQRVSVDLDAQIRRPTTTDTDLRHICRSRDAVPPDPRREMVEIVTNYAYPPLLASTDWTRSGDTGILRLGSAVAPLSMVETGTGTVIGQVHAVVLVRWSGAPATCPDAMTGPEQAVMAFDYAIIATGRVGTATRTVCLRSPSADACADWLPVTTSTAGWAGSHVLTGGTARGWPVVIVRGGPPPATHAAVRWPAGAPAFPAGDPLYERPHWEELIVQ
jgi:hypothetical protein